MFIFPFGAKKVLGIDLGSLNIKIVEVVKTKDKLEVTNFGIIPIINFKEIGSSSYILEENLALLLTDFLKNSNIKTKEAVFNIQAPYVFPINFFVPLIPEKNLPQVIRFETQKQVPFSLEEIEIEYRYQEFQIENQQKRWLVFMSVVPKNYIKKVESICNLAKLKFLGYGSEYLNFEPFFVGKLGNIVVFDLGHSYSTIYLFKDGKIAYANKISIKGYDVLDFLLNATNLPEDKVLDLFYEKGFAFPPEEKEMRQIVLQFLNNFLNIARSEIERLENMFLLRIEKIFWTGGLTVLPGFKEEMLNRFPNYEQEILIPTEIFGGDKFVQLGEHTTLLSQPLGVVFRKIMS